MKNMAPHILFLALLALAASQAIASDPSSLQDFCVADKMSQGTNILSLSLPLTKSLYVNSPASDN